ncbi:MAG: caspase family protein [Alphaproteobacteria bacterium]|jgi:uncharacterized protein YgiM (DUF1202 family)|nr:caspase family protein [Alphaproteobacteria bacterium]
MRYAIVLFFFLSCLASGSALTQTVDFGRYHALVIGINDYKHLPDLETAVNDASAVHDVLRREYAYESTLLLNPNRSQLVTALDDLRARLTERDNVLIFYAGHGYLDRPTDEGFWLTTEAEEDSQVEWVSISSVTRLLKASSAKHALVVADSCYSGVLSRDAPILLKVGAEREAELRRIAGKRARKALTSGGLEPVNDGGGDGHSVFTRAFLESLRENRQIVDGYQLFRELRQKVVLNAEQTPQYSDIRFAGDEGGDFLFVPMQTRPAVEFASAPTTPGVAQSDEPSAGRIEFAFWQSIQNSKLAADYEAYVAAYPQGKFSVLARNRLASLSAPMAKAEPESTPKKDEAAAEIAAWNTIRESEDAADYRGYLERYPDGAFAALVRIRMQALEVAAAKAAAAKPAGPVELAFWQSIVTSERAADFEAYLQAYPEGKFAPEAQKRLAALAEPKAAPEDEADATELAFWRSIQESRDANVYRAYLKAYPNGAFAPLAKARLGTFETKVSAVAPAKPGDLVPPKELTVALEPVEATYVAVKRANVRAEPTISSKKADSLPAGTEVYVPGRTTDGKWLRVERGDQALGYVYAPLLQEKSAWQKAKRESAEADKRRTRLAEQEAEKRARRQAEAQRKAEEQARREAEERALQQAEAERVAREQARQQAEAERQRKEEEARQREAEEAAAKRVALSVPKQPEPPRGLNGNWRLYVDMRGNATGHVGRVESVVSIVDGSSSGSRINSGAFTVWLKVTAFGDRIQGSLSVSPDPNWHDIVLTLDDKIEGDRFEKRFAATAVDQSAGYGGNMYDVVVHLRLQRVN